MARKKRTANSRRRRDRNKGVVQRKRKNTKASEIPSRNVSIDERGVSVLGDGRRRLANLSLTPLCCNVNPYIKCPLCEQNVCKGCAAESMEGSHYDGEMSYCHC